jgi:xanthine dehydrogenase accessory factor
MRPDAIDAFLAAGPAALVRVEAARGSTPREEGAWMLVSARETLGTIGGGQLEYMAIDAARAMLARGEDRRTLDIPLGPEIGQCCGGRVVVGVARPDAPLLAALRPGALPSAHVFGAGHVGRALAAALALLPLRVVLVDQRRAELDLAPAGVEAVLSALPEDVVRAAPPGSAFSVLTHDHALDFLIVREALARGDAAHVGMIGSATKRASFARWARRHGGGVDPGRLVCPIGAAGRPDKRPEVIAAFAAVEIMAAVNAFAPQTAGVAR